jgi:hypothetical protein
MILKSILSNLNFFDISDRCFPRKISRIETLLPKLCISSLEENQQDYYDYEMTTGPRHAL